MEYFEYMVLLFLSLIGTVSLIKSAVLSLCKDNGRHYKIVIPLDDKCENPETVIRNAATYLEWSDKKRYSGIYCIYKGKNLESKEICRRVCEDYPYTEYFDVNNFEKMSFFNE